MSRRRSLYAETQTSLDLHWRWSMLRWMLYFRCPGIRTECYCCCCHCCDPIWAVMIVWMIRGKIIRTVLCCIVWHNHMHTDMSSSYRWTVLGLHFVFFTVFIGASIIMLGFVILCLVYFLRCYCFLVVSTSAIDCLERLVSEITCYVSSGTLNHTHSLTLNMKLMISQLTTWKLNVTKIKTKIRKDTVCGGVRVVGVDCWWWHRWVIGIDLMSDGPEQGIDDGCVVKLLLSMYVVGKQHRVSCGGGAVVAA